MGILILDTSLAAPATPSGVTLSVGGTATSSALGLGDIAIEWSLRTGDADNVMVDGDIGVDRGITTSVILSLMLDRRAEDDDVPPSGDARDRRGWWADQLLGPEGDRIGSRLWLLDRSTRTNDNVLRAKQYAEEALAWMVTDRVVSGVEVAVAAIGALLRITVGLQRPGRDPISLRFDHVWQHQEGL